MTFEDYASISKETAKCYISETLYNTQKRFWTKGELIDLILDRFPYFNIAFIPWRFLDRYKTRHGNYNLFALIQIINSKREA